MSQPSLTIISVTGHQDYAQYSAYAIERSYLELKNKITDLRCILVSPEKTTHCAEFIQHLPCKTFSYLEYNLFILYGLDDIIETDFCLVVQADGWVLNGENWQDHFFDYDYLGAPTPDAYKMMPDGQMIKQENLIWGDYRNDPNNQIFNGQNGGFSLRSKKLLGMPKKLNLSLKINPANLNKTTPIHLELDSQHNEDVFLTIFHCKTLMNAGIKFANDSIAAQFSLESFLVNKTMNIPYSSTLGGHWLNNAIITGINNVMIQVPFKYWKDKSLSNTNEATLIQIFANLNYNITLLPD